MKDHFPPTRMSTIKKTDNNKDIEKSETLFIVSRNIIRYSHFGKQSDNFSES
jgi:hypothetical protein